MADKAGSALSRLLQRLPFKMPWQVCLVGGVVTVVLKGAKKRNHERKEA